MKVKFVLPFFAPGNSYKGHDGRVVSGQLYQIGIYDDIPDELKSKLPQSAVILDNQKAEPKPIPKKEPSLRDFDTDRANADATAEAYEKSEVQRKKRKPGRPKKYA